MLNYKQFPPAISVWKMMGPSFLILAMGLGSGEIIMWPYLVSQYGLGLAWGALLGLTFQFFLNLEIERYALVKGESIFVGFARILPWAPAWFIISTFVPWMLPGIIAASAQVLAHLLGWTSFKWLAMAMLLFIGLLLSASKTIYKTMERLTKTIILVGVPIIFGLVLMLVTKNDFSVLLSGIAGFGHNYWLIPEGISLAAFVGAFAYSGAGGNLNLAQSIYVKEKGYGMGAHSQKLSGLFETKIHSEVKLSGEHFEETDINLHHFKAWWRRINLEHFLIFWLLGLTAIFLLMMLSYKTAFGNMVNMQGVNFIFSEANAVTSSISGLAGIIFLGLLVIMLFQTQISVLDSTSRIMSENLVLLKMKDTDRAHPVNLSKIYFMFLWLQISIGLLLFAMDFYEPQKLIIAGAVLNAISMFIYIGLVDYLNNKSLPKPCRPKLWRRLIMALIWVFFGLFSCLVVYDKLIK